jgi:hypothetical protein
LKNFKKILSYFDFIKIDWNYNLSYYNKGILSKIDFLKFYLNEIYFLKDFVFNSMIYNYYKSDIYSINSKNMHLSSLDYLVRLKSFI